MEVIYTGLRQTPEMVVGAALQEDVDAIGISILSGAHMTVFPRIIQLMKERNMDDVLLTGGGIIRRSGRSGFPADAGRGSTADGSTTTRSDGGAPCPTGSSRSVSLREVLPGSSSR